MSYCLRQKERDIVLGSKDNCYPLDTGRNLNKTKTVRRRPGRSVNVACTFNLCPVSRG